ncbi:hypothetical protein ACQFX9_10415 [Aliinostoc sp. HNIBRCY26]|uniref:hypothetical protein n=1 Tax=Aliinostoc sp. HNIBRCY26 TaxID=3418997 RepID=UPI003D026B2C
MKRSPDYFCRKAIAFSVAILNLLADVRIAPTDIAQNLKNEVLSDSTEVFDRGDKFTVYQDLESLKEYIALYEDVVFAS